MYKFNVYFFNHSKKSIKQLALAIVGATQADCLLSHDSFLYGVQSILEDYVAKNRREFDTPANVFNLIKFKKHVPDDCIWRLTDLSGRVIEQSKDQLPTQSNNPMYDQAIKYEEQIKTAIRGLSNQVKFSTARNEFLEKSCEAFLKEKLEWMKENDELVVENSKLTKLANELTQKNARLSKRLMIIEKVFLTKDENLLIDELQTDETGK